MIGDMKPTDRNDLLKPQWIDLQVNGRVGVSFTDDALTEEGVLKVVEALRDGGTDAFLATITTCPDDTALHCLRTVRAAMKKYAECGRRILGFHMEGPFVSSVPGYSGAHNRAWTRDCDYSVYEKWQDASDGMVRIVTIDGARAEMSPKEYDLLFYLIKNKNIALTRERLITEVWGYDYFGDDRTLDTHIKLLRRSLGRYADFIVTLRGVGYRFDTDA